jgi:multisubunit Na+/H+ antiporter MnhB subunit
MDWVVVGLVVLIILVKLLPRLFFASMRDRAGGSDVPTPLPLRVCFIVSGLACGFVFKVSPQEWWVQLSVVSLCGVLVAVVSAYYKP